MTLCLLFSNPLQKRRYKCGAKLLSFYNPASFALIQTYRRGDGGGGRLWGEEADHLNGYHMDQAEPER